MCLIILEVYQSGYAAETSILYNFSALKQEVCFSTTVPCFSWSSGGDGAMSLLSQPSLSGAAQAEMRTRCYEGKIAAILALESEKKVTSMLP